MRGEILNEQFSLKYILKNVGYRIDPVLKCAVKMTTSLNFLREKSFVKQNYPSSENT